MLAADVEATIRNEAAPAADRPSLETIGRRCGTDKSAGWHGYLEFYERFFASLRDQPVRLLEIGVFRGQSVKMWSEYFHAGQIIGADIDPAAQRFAADRITIDIADQSNIAHLTRLGVDHGPFDIVVDDGSHIWNHQITALQYLFSFVKPGGFFVVEDIDTSFGAYVGSHKGNSDISAMQYLSKFATYLVGDAQIDIDAEPDPFIRTFARNTEFIAFHRRTAILRRHPDARSGRTPAEWGTRGSFGTSIEVRPTIPLIESNAGDVSPVSGSLTAHFGFRGDVVAEGDLLAGASDGGCSIQGFTVRLTDAALPGMEYRVLGAGGAWSDWMPSGTFAGTRGKAVPLRGFAVRLAGARARDYHCSYAGAFEGSGDVVFASDGESCAAPDGAALEAMHIVLRPR
jgi:predicted O-methyltransferase YrrM